PTCSNSLERKRSLRSLDGWLTAVGSCKRERRQDVRDQRNRVSGTSDAVHGNGRIRVGMLEPSLGESVMAPKLLFSGSRKFRGRLTQQRQRLSAQQAGISGHQNVVLGI